VVQARQLGARRDVEYARARDGKQRMDLYEAIIGYYHAARRQLDATGREVLTLNEIETTLLRIRDLVRVRELLRDRGASDGEIEEQSAEIKRLQWQLAEQVRRSVTAPSDQAA
jgi:hypothetical protein